MIPQRQQNITNGGSEYECITPDFQGSEQIVRAPHKEKLLEWYRDTFIADPLRGYALMNPLGHNAKYIRKDNPLTVDMIAGSFNGETRRLRVANRGWSSVPRAYALIPQTEDNLARNIVIDVDEGGQLALLKVLTVCQQFGLWAFAERGQSDVHDGGRVFVLGAELQPASMLAEIGQRLILAAGLPTDTEVWPKDTDLRLPLQIHLRAPGRPHRFPLIGQDGAIIDTSDAWLALACLHRKAVLTTPEQWTKLLDVLPSLPVGGGRTTPRHRSHVVPSSLPSVIGWFNDNHSLRELLEQAGADVGERRLLCCPFHDDRSPSLAIFRHGDKEVCLCFSGQSACPCSKSAANRPHFDSFDLYCLLNGLSAKQAVTKLVEDFGLGKQREFVIAQAQSRPAVCSEDALVRHRNNIAQAANDWATN